MPYTEAQKRASIKYMSEKTDDIRLRVRKGIKNRWKRYAALSEKSLTIYVCDAVERQISFDETKENEIDSLVLSNLITWLKSHGHSSDEIVDCLASLGKQT